MDLLMKNLERSIFWSLFFCVSFTVNAQQFDWAKSIGGLGTDVARDLTVDADGNVIVVGSFSGSASIDGTWMNGDGVLEAFIAKFSPSGDLLWTRVITGPGEDMARGVVTEEDGTIYVVGHFTDTVTFHGSGNEAVGAKGEGGKDLFIAKYQADGAYVWHLTGGGREDDTATDIDRYPWSGKLYVSGGFQERGKFGSVTLLANGLTDALLLKLDADGNVHWVRKGGGDEHDVAAAVAVDQTNESVYIAGDYYLEADFNGTELLSVGSSDMFLAKFNSDGDQEWVVSNGGTNVDVATDIGVDYNNQVYVCGYYQLTTNFQNHSATALGYNDVFLSQFDENGTCNWLTSAGSNALDNCLGMDVAWDGTTYMCGMFEDEIFAGNLSKEGDGYDIFILNHSSDGEIRYIKTAGAASSDFGMAACLAPDNSLYISGYYFFYANFDGTTIGNAENGDAFIARLTGVLDGGNLENDEKKQCLKYDQFNRSLWLECNRYLVVRVVDFSGRVVLETKMDRPVSLSHLTAGLYAFQLTDSFGEIYTSEIVHVR